MEILLERLKSSVQNFGIEEAAVQKLYDDTGPFTSASEDFVSVQTKLLDPVFEMVCEKYFQKSLPINNMMDKALDDKDIYVDSRVRGNLISKQNKLHICKKCQASGCSAEEARQVSDRYTIHRGDESGVSVLTCNRCGNVWRE